MSLSSIRGTTLAIGAISLGFVSIAALALISVVVALPLLRSAVGRTFTMAACLIAGDFFVRVHLTFSFMMRKRSEKSSLWDLERLIKSLPDGEEVSGRWP